MDPIELFREILARASAVDRTIIPEPTAFTLATATRAGRPSARVLLLKGVDERGFVFYTNYDSRKGRELLENPFAAMCFHWAPLELQVRVEGAVMPVPDAEADAYFASRPRGSQIGAWASAQSRVIEQDGELEQRVADLEAKYANGPVPRPAHWSGFRLVPATIEFWQNMPSRLHRRHRYTRRAGGGPWEEGGWRVDVLFP